MQIVQCETNQFLSMLHFSQHITSITCQMSTVRFSKTLHFNPITNRRKTNNITTLHNTNLDNVNNCAKYTILTDYARSTFRQFLVSQRNRRWGIVQPNADKQIRRICCIFGELVKVDRNWRCLEMTSDISQNRSTSVGR